MTDLAGKGRAVVRPRDAASLILLRGHGSGLEVLMGRRPLSFRFMPGAHVFPGGAIDPPDRLPWAVEAGAAGLAPRLAASARAALRETWEEAGILVGRKAAASARPAPHTAIERAYHDRGLVAALDALTYVGRAITPSHSRRRFNTRFFLGNGDSVFGEPASTEEFEDVGWQPVGRELLGSLRDVTRFMLARAIALHAGAAAGEPPLFYWAGNRRRIGVCRENLR